jgi:tRNA threonylcarbamoyladenosine biosynthesis protein TsaE
LTGGAGIAYHGRVLPESVLISPDPETTLETGRRIGERLQPGDVLCLEGVLGSGKTTLVKGIAESLGVEEPVTSPTFTLVSRYRGRRQGREVELVHIDLYRIAGERELEDLGLEEAMGAEAIAVIEWGEKAASILPPQAVRVRLELAPKGARRLRIEGLSL